MIDYKTDFQVFHSYVHSSANELVGETLSSTMLSEGNRVKEFQHALFEKLGIVNPVALNSGTTALHLAMVLAGIEEGDEVICPAQTFVASALVIVQQKAKPVFADINYLTGNIDPVSIREKITSRTKAIVVVHWGGMPCDMDEIQNIATEFNLTVIEDAAHAPGATYKNKFIGSISEYTCFSFQAIKHITTGDGGALSCLNEHKLKEAYTKRWFGIDRSNATSSILGERQYNISELGFKYHMNDFSAALGIANMTDIESRLQHLRSIATLYRDGLNDIPGIQLWDCPSDRESAWWLFGMHVEKRIDFIKAMKSRGITASVIHQRIDRNSIFGGLDESLENQRSFDETQIHIPLHNGIDQKAATYIVNSIKQGW